jgi:hypothetical protein
MRIAASQIYSDGNYAKGHKSGLLTLALCLNTGLVSKLSASCPSYLFGYAVKM